MNNSRPQWSNLLLTVFIGVFFLGAGVLVIQSIRELVPLAEVKFFGAEAQATVSEKTWEPAEGRRIAYSFELPGGGEYSGRVPVSEKLWRHLNVGDVVTVRYGPESPSRSILAEGDLVFGGAVFELALQLLFLLLLGYGLSKGFSLLRRKRSYT